MWTSWLMDSPTNSKFSHLLLSNHRSPPIRPPFRERSKMPRTKTFRVRLCLKSPLILLPSARRSYAYCSRRLQKKNPNRNKSGGQKRERDIHKPGERGNYPTIPSENPLYEHFYRESNLVPKEEWDDFWSALKRTLPTTFRFTGSKGFVVAFT